MNHKRNTVLPWLLLMISVATNFCSLPCFGQHASYTFTTQLPGGPKRAWHTMAKRWERGIFTIGKLHPIDTVESNGSSIFVVAGTTLARIEKRSGLVTWKKRAAGGRNIGQRYGGAHYILDMAD